MKRTADLLLGALKSRANIPRASGHFVTLLAAQAASAALQAISLLLLARWTSAQQFGSVAAAIAILGVVAGLGDLGLGTLAVRWLARGKAHRDLVAILRAARTGTTLSGICGLTIVTIMFQAHIPWWSLGVLTMYSIVDRVLHINLGIFIAAEKPIVNLGLLALARGGLLAGMILSYQVFSVSAITSYAISALIGSAIAVSVCNFLLGRLLAPNARIFRVASLPARGPLFRESLSYWVASASALVRTLDVSIVAAVAGPGVAAIYAVPSRVTGPLRLLPQSLNRLTIPYAARGDARAVAQLTSVLRYVLFLMTVAVSILSIFATEILVYAVGPDYAAAAWPLRILAVAILINVVGSFKSGLLQGTGEHTYIARLGATLAVWTLVSVATLTLCFGAVGAALAILSTYSIQFLAVTQRYRKVA